MMSAYTLEFRDFLFPYTIISPILLLSQSLLDRNNQTRKPKKKRAITKKKINSDTENDDIK